MNIPNVIDLVKQLEAIGFRDMGSRLLKRICFKPTSFSLSQQVEKGNELIKVQILFEKRAQVDSYVLVYYDATLREELELPENPINDVNIIHLEKEMAAMDWRKAFELDEIKLVNLEDKTSWQNEQKIESIINDLAALEITEEGKNIKGALKLKFWEDTSYHDLFSALQIPKSKTEVSQRFYLFPDQPGISIDEATRFLQNKRLERRLLYKRKHTVSPQSETLGHTGANTAGNGFSKKKRPNDNNRSKQAK